MTKAEIKLSEVKPAAKIVVDISAFKKLLHRLIFYDRKRNRNSKVNGGKKETGSTPGNDNKKTT
jgi:hypothetical protein